MKKLSSQSQLKPIDNLRRELDRIFDDMVPFTWSRRFSENEVNLWAPKTDMTETEQEYIINLDLPGVKKDDVEVSYKDNQLTISGERKKEVEEKKETYIRSERYFGQFVRNFTLPAAVKDNNIKANFKDGVLVVKVPKAEVSKPKKVKID